MKRFANPLIVAACSVALTALASTAGFAEQMFGNLDMAPDKVGKVEDMQDMKNFCGTKPIKVALSDGWGANGWRKITRAEFEDEAAKCPNITEVRYTNGEGNPQKQISDIQGLIAQKFDVIILYPDGGEAILGAMNEATQAGIAVVPYDLGEGFPGTRGEDYLLVTTESVVGVGKSLAEWTVKQLGEKGGNIIVLGGTPGNPTSAAMAVGWKSVFDQHPEIKVLEGPVDTNWDPAEAQKVMAGMLSKYDKIDAVMSDYGQGSMGALRAFVAAGRKIPLWPSQDANELGCFWHANKDANPDFKLATVTARTWLSRLALRKGVAAAQGMNNTEPSIIELPLAEDSTDPAKQPKCETSLPPDAILSSMLPVDKLVTLLAK